MPLKHAPGQRQPGFCYETAIDAALGRLHTENRYRRFTGIRRIRGAFPRAVWTGSGGTGQGDTGPGGEQEITLWCSNDYLGMGQHQGVLDAFTATADRVGTGAGGTRNISGTHSEIVKLERALADFHGRESALVFTSGYVANEAAISALARLFENCVLISDAENHASMIAGVRSARCEKVIFRHNDLDHLAEILTAIPVNRPKIVVFESVYSMDGDRGKVAEIIHLAKAHNALTYVDEVHAVGMYGQTGAGVCAELGLSGGSAPDLIQGTMGKAIGVVGGYIAGGAKTVDAIRSYAGGFIFTTTLPPAVCAAARESIAHLKTNHGLRLQQRAAVAAVKAALAPVAEILPGDTHIVPLMVRDAEKCRRAGQHLLEQHGIYIQPINYPTVKTGTERLRITPTPFHDAAMIKHLSTAIADTWQRLGITP